MGKIDNFMQLDVWKLAHTLVLDVYKFTSILTNEEKYSLISQMKRASVSVPANIAEGFKRKGQNDKAHFYNIAQGSLEELRYYFILVNDLGYKVNLKEMNERIDQIGRMLSVLIKSVRR
ncbi:MAG: four helix bundle protein [Nitrospirota bacterium]